MDAKKVLKFAMPAVAATLTLVSGLISSKLQDDKMNETIAKKVEEALSNQAGESK